MFSRSPIATFAFVVGAGTATAFAGTITPTTLYFSDAFNYTNAAQYGQYSPNLTAASANGSDDGETVSSSANLATGTLRILNEGSVTQGFSVSDASYASLGDTITATGATAGLNLGVNLQVNGSTQTNAPADDDTFLVVAAYAPGVFDSNAYSTPLWAEGFGLGTDSGGAAPGQSQPGSGVVSLYGITSLTNSFANGSATIPLNIPFSSLPSTFDIFIAMGSYEVGSDITTWTNDYSHTLTVALSAPQGVTLTSASGDFPGTATPEPSTFALVGMALIASLAVLRKRIKT